MATARRKRSMIRDIKARFRDPGTTPAEKSELGLFLIEKSPKDVSVGFMVNWLENLNLDDLKMRQIGLSRLNGIWVDTDRSERNRVKTELERVVAAITDLPSPSPRETSVMEGATRWMEQRGWIEPPVVADLRAIDASTATTEELQTLKKRWNEYPDDDIEDIAADERPIEEEPEL